MLDHRHGVQFSTYEKASVESSVQVITRWVLMRLRNRRFDTVAQVDAAIAELLPSVNERPFQKLPGSRACTFAEIDAPVRISANVTAHFGHRDRRRGRASEKSFRQRDRRFR